MIYSYRIWHANPPQEPKVFHWVRASLQEVTDWRTPCCGVYAYWRQSSFNGDFPGQPG